MTIINKMIFSLLLIFPFVINAAESNTLRIKNDDNSSVEVIIEPGEGTILKNSPQVRLTIPSGKVEEVEIKKDQLGNFDTISVTGRTTMPSLYNKCSGLFISKDYDIVFTPSKAGGVICYHSELNSGTHKAR